MKQADSNHTPAPAILKFAGEHGRLGARQDHEDATNLAHDEYLLTLLAMHQTRGTFLREATGKCYELNAECNRLCPPSEALQIRESDSGLENLFPYSEFGNEDPALPGFYSETAVERLMPPPGPRSAETKARVQELMEAAVATRSARVEAYERTGFDAQEAIADAHLEALSAIEQEIVETPAHSLAGAFAKLRVIEFYSDGETTIDKLLRDGSCDEIALSVAADLIRLNPARSAIG